MANGRGLALKPSQVAEETFFVDSAEADRLNELKWVDKKLVVKELSEIKKRIEELEMERKLVEESLKKITQSNLPKASSDFYYVRRNVERSIENARKLWVALAGAEAAGALAAALASGSGLLIAGAAGTFGVLGSFLGSRSLASKVDAEIERVGKGVQLVEVRERLKDELHSFERESRKLQRRRDELMKLCGIKAELPIKEHINRVRAVMDNLEIMHQAQLALLKRMRRKKEIPPSRLREIHDSVQELAFISSPGDEVSKSFLIQNIAREMSADIIMRSEGVSDISSLTQNGLNSIGRAASLLEKHLSNLKYVPPAYFE